MKKGVPARLEAARDADTTTMEVAMSGNIIAARNRYPVEILTAAEVDGLIRTCSRRAPTGRRNAGLIALLHSSAIRISEALSLEPRDVDLESGTVNVRSGKGSRQRIVGLNARAIALLGAGTRRGGIWG